MDPALLSVCLSLLNQAKDLLESTERHRLLTGIEKSSLNEQSILSRQGFGTARKTILMAFIL